MHKPSKCPECGNGNVYSTPDVSAGGGYAPNYLPGLGSLFSAAKFTVVVCKDCGFTRLFASKAGLGKLSESSKWRKV
jgi:predicted nucleic-acid-binding Zn-ribbon protein